jgi:hypothetical protein
VLATPALGRLIRGRVRPLISLAYPAQDQVPRLVRAAHTGLVPARVRSLAVQLRNTSNEADQHRPRTAASGPRRAETTPIDHPARSSGRRGREFTPVTPTLQVTRPTACVVELLYGRYRCADLDRGGWMAGSSSVKLRGPMSWVDVGGEFVAAAVARLPMCRVRRGPIQWV